MYFNEHNRGQPSFYGNIEYRVTRYYIEESFDTNAQNYSVTLTSSGKAEPGSHSSTSAGGWIETKWVEKEDQCYLIHTLKITKIIQNA